jgi:hypothetical protein
MVRGGRTTTMQRGDYILSILLHEKDNTVLSNRRTHEGTFPPIFKDRG